MKSVYIDSIASVIGEPFGIEKLPECKQSPADLQVLQQEGYENFLAASESIEEMAIRSLQKTLNAGKISPDQIDILIFSSDSAGDQRERECNSKVHNICVTLGLVNAYPLGINQSTCGNFCSSLRVASSLLLTGEAKNILLVMAEKSENGKRIMDSNAAVLSDGAASCLVSTSEHSGFKLLGTSQSCCHSLGTESEAGSKVFLALNGFQNAFESFIQQYGIDVGEVKQLLPNNYNRTLLTMYSQISRIDMKNIYTDNLSAKAHVYSCDN
jgi:3-oxoacyl-[acyl-carrier-protein] synthase-3